jgi:hypothetical protein
MAGLDTTLIADALRGQAAEGIQKVVYRHDTLHQLFEVADLTGGATWNKKTQYTAATVAAYSEADAAPTASNQTYITQQWPVGYYWFKISVTGHARDQLEKGNGAAFFDQIAMEYEDGVKDLVTYWNDVALGTGSTPFASMEYIVDSASVTVAGLARGTYTWFKAYEAAGAATTIAFTDIHLAVQTTADSPGGAKTDLWMGSFKQCNKILGVYGLPGASNAPVRTIAGANGYEVNLGSFMGMAVGNAPILPVPTLTNSILLGLQRDTWKITRQRDITVKPLGATKDTDEILVTMAKGIACTDPRKNIKITTLTA